jgi:hypothetical protein
MPQPSLADLTAAAAAADGPSFTPISQVQFGGVDPLGLRQINFDLMDRVFPALNNVARHIRPFVVVAWACRRAAQLAARQGVDRVAESDLVDFVSRIEVIYAWSQLLRNPDADLPGSQFLGPILRADRWVFGGPQWKKLCEQRRGSTAFTAAINYGPSLKALGWVEPHPRHPRVLLATESATPALDAFEAIIADRLDHPTFSQFGTVEVTTEEAGAWSEVWALETATDTEKRVMAAALAGAGAPLSRRDGCALMIAAAQHASTTDLARVRATMTGVPSNFSPPAELLGSLGAWRRVQIRQLFRLALEALFYWIFLEIEDGAQPTQTLANSFLARASPRSLHATTRDWLNADSVANSAPTALIAQIERALTEPALVSLVPGIADGIVFCLAGAGAQNHDQEPEERLPLTRARREADAPADAPVKDFVCHVIESWVLAQHTYWSIGRGLADARARGKSLLRLKVILEEGGWAKAPGVSRVASPVPTADRLGTALSLVQECGLLAAYDSADARI